ncbi:glutaredoxin [bacteria symbiont BFo1 of Frankliniella occidentalis]|uniref:Glutaredoxin 2 n=1 Tax=Erwinia aphidicola TaxID=68334 RepID=A0ABU8DD33_ERWAP|nr:MULTISPECIES: glutaredoxin 2 [Erwinia]KMV70095.1 glutaredoxin [bacteria symbiont BFo1 of Frankliniella occidentalis]PIJ51119.1 glutaredoxin 2 [Erwinia sp. OLMDLW33]KYP84404.1 glutaredoxin [bacteria symbiont BFo1 of Frankliniella occidentalis]KYP91008.1 glutaredoxin [bacteria symbiont BFo1 of Frankliniella occidentalis]MBD1374231.1 glutaredoxin 2 [Erwinia aphidicola]
MKLYIYEHCPFCVKARMIFGLKNLPVELVVMLNDDEATPTRLIGQKMAPILMKEDGSCMPESLDIVHYIDRIDREPLLTGKTNPAITDWLRHINSYVNKLLIPRVAEAPFAEFATPEARDYFKNKKQGTYGDFSELREHSAGWIKNVNDDLRKLDKLIVKPNAVSGELSLDDIHLFPLLRSLSLVAGIEYPSRVADYRDNMAKQTQINLLSSVAS